MGSSERTATAVPRAGAAGDRALVRALRAGDQRAFARIVDEWGPVMLRMASIHAPSRAVAEEVVQEAWCTFLTSLDRYAGRSSLRTWTVGIVLNLARSRARAERRAAPHADVGDVIQRARFRSAADRWPHHWAIGPAPWPTPEQELLKGELLDVLVRAMAALPAAQREVVVLRDVEGWPPEEVCNVLGLSDTNQRVLLHRGRTRLRKALEDYLGATETT